MEFHPSLILLPSSPKNQLFNRVIINSWLVPIQFKPTSSFDSSQTLLDIKGSAKDSKKSEETTLEESSKDSENSHLDEEE